MPRRPKNGRLSRGLIMRDGRVYVRARVPGRKNMRWKSFGPASAETIRQARLFLFDLQRNSQPEARETLAGFFQVWLDQWGRLNRCDKSLAITGQQFRDHVLPVCGNRKLTDFGRPLLLQLRVALEARGLKPETVRGILSNLRCVLGYACEVPDARTGKPILSARPSFRKVLPRIPELIPRRLAPEELDRIRELPAGLDRDVTMFLLLTGLRWSELQKLTWRNVLRTPRPLLALDRTKSGRIRRVPLVAGALEVLDRWKQGRDSVLVCPYRVGQGHALGHRVERLTGVHFTPHRARHTFASVLHERGVPLGDIRILLGHADIRTTMRYLGIQQDSVDGALDGLDLLPPPGAQQGAQQPEDLASRKS